jgi:hypothetical protein
MVLLQLRLLDRLAAFWGATVTLTVAYWLFIAYREPNAERGMPRFVNKYWSSMYGVLPRTYMIAMAVVCLLIGLMCLIAGFLSIPSTRPPFR